MKLNSSLLGNPLILFPAIASFAAFAIVVDAAFLRAAFAGGTFIPLDHDDGFIGIRFRHLSALILLQSIVCSSRIPKSEFLIS
jgi:hypothetical protein